jgi:hypothetical protein
MTGAAVVIIAVLVFFAALLLLMALPPRVQVTVLEDALLVEPEGLDVLWTVRRRVTIPIDKVESVRVGSRNEAPRLGIRLPGAYFPGIITAGSYGTGAKRTFWDVRRAQLLLLIACKPGAEYKMVVLEVRDPHAVAQRAQTVLHG